MVCDDDLAILYSNTSYTQWCYNINHDNNILQWPLATEEKLVLQKIKIVSKWKAMLIQLQQFACDCENHVSTKTPSYTLVNMFNSHYTVHGKYLAGWRTIQIKAVGEENLANKPQSMHMSNTFLVYLWILVKKTLNCLRFAKFAKYFPCTVVSKLYNNAQTK